MRSFAFLASFVFAMSFLSCGEDAPETCLAENNCELDAQGVAQCMSGYAWEDADSSTNYNCVQEKNQYGTQPADNSGGNNGGNDGGNNGGNDGGNNGGDNGGNNGGNNGGCPANSSPQDGACYCDDGYVVNDAGTACVPGESGGGSGGCPPNSHLENGNCYCDAGFVINADQTGCVYECVGDGDCGSGLSCIDNQCRVPPCTMGSCGAGFACDSTSGLCLADVGTLPATPSLSCSAIPASLCDDTDVTCVPDWQCTSNCSQLIPFEPIHGDGYWNYPLNGESNANQYRSYVRRDAMMLIKYAASSVRCMETNWNFGVQEPLGLGDMSEGNGAIPGTSIGQPGHPDGTHENGFDLDIAYYQMTSNDNTLRSVCPHVSGGYDQNHCVSSPDNFDVWRTAVFFAKLHDSPYLRVIGVDGKIGPMVESAVTQMCNAGWISGNACATSKLAYETSNQGQGWYYFHHHHFHVSNFASTGNGLSFFPENKALCADGCVLPMRENDPRRFINKRLQVHLHEHQH
ncbi:MAG: hypothetical protein QGI45_13690 [Myxococcota bacterium]|nr:hypothetical protein [Myxococcota bacterium]